MNKCKNAAAYKDEYDRIKGYEDVLTEDDHSQHTVLKLRKIYPHIKLRLILPCPSDEQTRFWNDYYKRFYYRINELADSVEICSAHYYSGCMKKRNERLVQFGDICVCYYDGREGGGTTQTVDMAKDKSISIINLHSEQPCEFGNA